MIDAHWVRTTLDIDDDVLQAAKEIGALQKKPAGRIISDLARQSLQAKPRAEIRNGVPLLPTGSGSLATMHDVNRIRDEE